MTLTDYARELLGADTDLPAGQRPMRGRYQGRRGAIRDSTRDD